MFLQVSMYLGWGMRKGNSASPFFCSWRSLPKISVSSIHALRLVKKISFMYTPGVFQTAASMLYLRGTVCSAVFIRVGILFPIALWLSQSLASWFLKFQVLNCTDYKNLQSEAPLVFKAKSYRDSFSQCGSPIPGVLVWALLLFLLHTCGGPPSHDSLVGQLGSQPCLYPSYSFQRGLSSMCSCGESVLQVFGSFSGWITLMWVLLSCICGMRYV